MIAARHSPVAQQAALQAQARRLARDAAAAQGQQPQRGSAARAAAAGSAPGADPRAADARAHAEARAPRSSCGRARARRAATLPKIGRNDPCHCGSGKKYKNCHMKDDQAVPNGLGFPGSVWAEGAAGASPGWELRG